ncbi:MAG: hypothetical protein MUP74_05090, partial [Desulfobacterales bacterium]|nr:hypothetical protein [Desulfobacterales bacterium]
DRVLAVWQDFETHALAHQTSLEKTALELHAKDRGAAREILTRQTTGLSLKALDAARRMAGELHTAIAKTGSKWINDPGG